MATNNSKPKLQKFNGTKSKIKITSWISLFEVVAVGQSITEHSKKAALLMEYLEDEALQFFADEVAADILTIEWSAIKTKLTKRFGEQTIDPVLAASRRRWNRGQESVQDYFEDKMFHLRRTGLSDASMAEVLTDGMPFGFRNNLISATIATPSEWLSKAVRLESSFSSAPKSDHPKAIAAVANMTSRKDSSKKSKRPPPGPCKFCTNLGKSGNEANHWHSDCRNKPQSSNQSPNHSSQQSSQRNHQAIEALINEEVNTATSLNY